MKRPTAVAAVLMTFGLILGGCGNHGHQTASKTQHTAALVTDGGGIDDKSFNQSAWEGLQKWGKHRHLKKGIGGYNYVQSSSDADFMPNINKLIKAKYQTIFALGYTLNTAVDTAAKQNPQTNFAIIDSIVPHHNNVTSVQFKTEQSSYLAGVAAAKTTKTKKVGFIGGVKSNVITTFERGFTQGVHAVDPSIKVDVKYVGAFTKADVGKSLASAMFNNGADIIFHAAGGSGAGVFSAAKDNRKNNKKVWVIGVDQDQKADGQYSGGNVTLASAIKKVDTAVEDIADKADQKKFPGNKIVTYDLKGKGVDLINDNLSVSAQKAVQEYRQKIIKGQIMVKSK
ncbi:BMP family lipoprotein [Bombilactobacillus bombi]|uniref:BMP family lipoprotein n=1 Tax=Bombilactobacillus bombi TaxID=1303590 RepID=UPI0015E59F92|nr:BMP family protein [Bombilactobacillus bombi]MBA1434073.1 BMP family ABC transporter substrate-binding protein [Bombilactobacillus bombi]